MNEIRVTRANPALVIFMVDMSGSMSEETLFDHKAMSKNEALTRIVNTTLSDIVCSCRRGNDYYDYFYLSVLGYDGRGVTSLLSQYNDGKSEYVSIKELMSSNVKKVTYHSVAVVDGKEQPRDLSVWQFVEIGANQRTPMLAALTEAHRLGKKWITSKGAESVIPIFINITDGYATDAKDGELIDMAKKIKSLRTSSGNAILMNIHAMQNHSTIIFPLTNQGLDVIKNAEVLYEMSSELPEWVSKSMADKLNLKWVEGDKYRAFGYNTSMTQLLDILQIGSLSL